jgi:hypothetical protein
MCVYTTYHLMHVIKFSLECHICTTCTVCSNLMENGLSSSKSSTTWDTALFALSIGEKTKKKTPSIINPTPTPSDSTLLTHTPHQLPTLLLIKLLTLVFYFFFLFSFLVLSSFPFLYKFTSFCISNPLFRPRAYYFANKLYKITEPSTAYYDGELLQ